jgi:hypothetical protein
VDASAGHLRSLPLERWMTVQTTPLTPHPSDPFFADVEGARHGFAWTGHDDFAGNNVDSMRRSGARAPWGGDGAAGAPPLTRLAACP